MLSLRTVVALSLFLSGCGPVMSMSAISKANMALDLAEESGAPEKALYHYTLGVKLIDKAWEEQGYSNYHRSTQFAEEARDALEMAHKEAGRNLKIPDSTGEEMPNSESNTSEENTSWGS